jgi:hypothetical protein
MLRTFLAALAALLMSACSYGSMVDMAPHKDRISRPVVSPGDYCEAKGETAPFIVVSSEDCIPITWDQAARAYTMVDPEDDADSIRAGVISLGAGLYAAQVDARDDGSDQPDRYQLFLLLSRGDAFAILQPLEDEPLRKLAARHTRIVFREDRARRPYIVSGANDRIRNFLRDAAKESLRALKAEGEQVTVGVRDKAGAPDHAATARQAKDIEAVMALARAMTPN